MDSSAGDPGSGARRLLALVFVAVLGVGLAGAGRVPLLDDDEPRFADASRTMARGGSWLVPRFNGRERFDKPPLVYWLQAAALGAVDDPERATRLPSAAAVAAASALTARCGLLLGLGTPAAAVAGLALGTGFQVQLLAHAATADGLLLFLTTAVAVLLLERSRSPRPARSAVVLWILLGLAILTKGPAALVAPAALAAGLWRSGALGPWRRRERIVGPALLLAVVLAWLVPAALATDGRVLREGLLHHGLARAFTPFEGHGGWSPVWLLFFAVTVPLGFLPWSAFLPRVVSALRAATPVAVTLRWWLLGTLLVFTLAASKLPHYPVPAFPALALALGFGLEGRTPRGERWFGAGLGLLALAVLSALALRADVLVPAALRREELVGSIRAGALLLAVPSLLSTWAFFTARRRVALAAATVLGTVGVAFLANVTAPRLGALTLGPRLADAVEWRRQLPSSGVLCFEPAPPPGVVFYLDRAIRRSEDADCADRVDVGLSSAPLSAPPPPAELGGLDLGRGVWWTVTRAEPSPTP